LWGLALSPLRGGIRGCPRAGFANFRLQLRADRHTFARMRILDPQTGRAYYEKRRRRYNEPGQPRELTFSCYRRYAFISRERTREWCREAVESARSRFGIELWAYVLMPDHVHLLVYPGSAADRLPQFLQAVKEPVGRKALAYLRANAPDWLPRLTVR